MTKMTWSEALGLPALTLAYIGDGVYELGVRRYVTEFWYKEGGETPAEVRARFGALLDRQISAIDCERTNA